ncbi:MAG: carboxypeptidase-like regulatory domain-containing protein [Planctomycetota bacterium]
MTQRRILVTFGLLGAIAGIALLIWLLSQESPRPDLPEFVVESEVIHAPAIKAPETVPQDGTLRGKVIHGVSGEPIRGARVMAVAQYTQIGEDGKPIWGHMRAKKSGLSDADGMFSLEKLPPDYWNLWVEKPGFGFTSIPRAKFANDHVVKLFPGASVRGRVILPDGGPAEGVKIEYTPQGTQSEVFSRFRRKAYFTVTDETGGFSYDGLPPTKFTIEVYPKDYLPAPWKFEPALKYGEDRDLGVHRLDGGFGMTVKVLLHRSMTGVPDVTVNVRPIGDPMPRTTTGQSRMTDESGIARFQGLGGQVIEKPYFSVTATIPGQGIVMPDEKRLIGPDETITIFVRESGIVKGRVVKPGGEPLPHFFVHMQATSHRTGPPTHGSGEDGEFTVYNIPEGTYRIRIQDTRKEFQDHWVEGVQVAASGETDIGTIVMEEGAEIAGVVRRSNGKPLDRRVRVVLARKVGKDFQHLQIVYCDKEGTYRLRGLPSGSFVLWPDDMTATNDPVPVVLAPGQGFLEKDLVLVGEGRLKLWFEEEIDGELKPVSRPPCYLVRLGTTKRIRFLGSGHPLKPGKYEVLVTVKLENGVKREHSAGVFAVKELEDMADSTDPKMNPTGRFGERPKGFVPEGSIRIRLDKVRYDAQKRADKEREDERKANSRDGG